MSAFKSSKRTAKFDLSDDESDGDANEVYMGFTHKGRPLEMEDDFKEQIEDSDSGDEDE